MKPNSSYCYVTILKVRYMTNSKYTEVLVFCYVYLLYHLDW